MEPQSILNSLRKRGEVGCAMFRLRAYGGLTLERDGAPYAGPATQRRRLALLVILAASDTGVSRERLTDYLWPDADPARGRHSLDGALSGLRRELGSDALFLGVATLHLNPEVLASDLAEESAALAAGDAERAAAVYSGPFLDGFYVSGAGAFERWVETERDRRARAHARLLERLAAAASALGDDAAAVHWHQRRVALDPLDTPATLGLLGALTAVGNRAEALRMARVHEALVRSEFDATPGPAWAAAVEALRVEGARQPNAAATAVTSSAAGDAGAALTPLPSPISTDADNAPRTVRGGARPAIMRRLARLALAACVLLLAGLAVRALLGRGGSSRAAGERASVAVVPFANTSGDAADEHFSDGLTDELISALSKVPELKVTGHTSAFALKSRGLTVRTIADTLGVATVLEGSVRRAGDRLKVTAQLVSASDNSVLWSESYDRSRKDIFTVQEEIARAIVGALAPALRGQATPAKVSQPRDLATYELYLEGRYFLGRRTAADFQRAVGYFEQAVARDPTYARAWAGLADAHVLLVVLADRPPREELPPARAAAARAIRLDATLAEAHAALGNIRETFDWDARGADEEFALAVALDPSYSTAHLYRGIHLVNRGRFDDALAELTQARALDPLSAPVRMQLGRSYVSAHRPDEAITVLRTALELNPLFAAAHVQLGEAYLEQGKTTEAVAAFRTAAVLGGARDSAQLAYALATTGERRAAMGIVEALLASPEHSYLPPVQVAKAYVALNDADAAFAWLERGYEERAAQMRGLKVSPGFDRLHADRRWAPLLRRLGLEP